MKNLCNINFQSQYAFVTSTNPGTNNHIVVERHISIAEYLRDTTLQAEVKSKDKYLVCQNGHVLGKYKSNVRCSHFRHKRSCDVGGDPMTEWHASWQGCFINTEVEHCKLEGNHKKRFADVLVHNNVLEFQHSRISSTEVAERQQDYAAHGRQLNWIVDGSGSVKIERLEYSGTYLVTFTSDFWKYESFMCHDYIYVHLDGDMIVKIHPSCVKSNMIDVRQVLDKETFILSLKENLVVWDDTPLPQCTLYHNQRGAGCGKTYESIQLLSQDTRFRHKSTFIYLTKMHSAKEIIYKEFQDQYKDGKLMNIEVCDDSSYTGKQYKVSYFNKLTSSECEVIIGTIDSFIYALGNKENRHRDFFRGLLESIKGGYNAIGNDGGVKYASKTTYLNKRCLVLIDEAQDLDKSYIESIAMIMRNTYVDAYVIGDKLQSIWSENNIYTFLEHNELPYTTTIHNIGSNVVRRFHHPKFMPFVNSIIDFNKYNLPAISGICDGKCKYHHEDDKDAILVFEHEPIYSNEPNTNKLELLLQRIIIYIKNEVKAYNYLPHNFMFIFPFMKSNTLADALEAKLQSFWIQEFDSKEYQEGVLARSPYWKDKINDGEYYRLAYLHRSDENKPINIKESEYATRLLSIHASKGQGCEVVFLLNLTEASLCRFSRDVGNLVYDSLLHVAVTRQKKSIYVGLQNNNDDIYERFSASRYVDVVTSNPSLSMVSKTTKLQDIVQDALNNKFQEIDSTFLQPFGFDKLIPEGSKDDSIIDWGHHVIRYNVFFYAFMFKIINTGRCNKSCESKQIFKVLNSVKDLSIKAHLCREYYKSLKDINTLNSQQKPLIEFPILSFQAKDDSKYYEYRNVLQKFIKRIQLKLQKYLPKGRLPKLCPLEMTIICHMLDITCNGMYSTVVTMMSLYEVIYVYDKCSHVLEEDHDEYQCMCKKSFCKQGHTKLDEGLYEDVKNSIKNHYEVVNAVELLFESFQKIMVTTHEDNSTFVFNIFHPLWFNGDTEDFKINHSVEFIAHSDKHVVYFIIKPNLNKLNINDVLLESLFSKWLIGNCTADTNNYERYNDKKVLVCIFAFNASSPIIFDPLQCNNEKITVYVEECLRAKYLAVNKKVIELYEHCSHTRPKTKNSIQCMLEKVEEYDKLPPYIARYFTIAEDKCKHLPLSEKKKVVSIDSLNECANEAITKFMHKSLDELDCDF
jgi:hypothetical protein